MTSTATLQAALDVMKNSDPSIGYSIAYPFGVIGPILCIYFMTRMVQPKFPQKAQRFHMGEVTLGDNYAGRTLEEITKDLPSGVQVTMVRKGGQNIVPSPDIVLAPGDGLLIVAEQEEAIAEAGAALESWNPDESSRIVLRSTISGFSWAKPIWSGCRLRSSRCQPAFRRIFCMSGAMTQTSFRRLI